VHLLTARSNGGSTTAILVNIPGESSSVVTCLDGYQMARQGRAGPAPRHSGDRLVPLPAARRRCSSPFFAAPPLAELALKFGPAEYLLFSLMVLGLVAATRARATARSSRRSPW